MIDFHWDTFVISFVMCAIIVAAGELTAWIIRMNRQAATGPTAQPEASHATQWLNAHTAFEQAADDLERQRLKARIDEIEAATVWKMTRTNGRIHVEFLDGSEVEGPTYD